MASAHVRQQLHVHFDGNVWCQHRHSGAAITLMKNYSGGGGTGRNDSTRAMDFNGNRKANPTIYRPSTGTWYSLLSGSNYTANASVVLGTITDRPVGGDFDGDGQADVAVYRPSGMWSILLSGASFASGYNAVGSQHGHSGSWGLRRGRQDDIGLPAVQRHLVSPAIEH